MKLLNPKIVPTRNARKELGIPSDRVVLIKVAAFREGKNHAGLLKELSKFEETGKYGSLERAQSFKPVDD